MTKNLCRLTVVMLMMLSASVLLAQKKDKARFIKFEHGYIKTIRKAISEFEKKDQEPRLRFTMDFSRHDVPKSPEEFKTYWRNEPVSQGITGMCWCFAGTSFLESECYRLNKKQIKFSEIHTAYWEYVEKARRFVRQRGDSNFSQGSVGHAVLRIWNKYGCVPADVYNGMKPGQTFHSHNKMYKEMSAYLMSVKRDSAWHEETVLTTIKSILNHYLGEPPKTFMYDGREMTPKQFMRQVAKISPDDYIPTLSLMQAPYWQLTELNVRDNWWHSKTYHNIPLDDFMDVLKRLIKTGHTLFLGGDVTESGHFAGEDLAMIPSYDIPSDYIDENARQFRFSNRSTSDDHAVHLVGYQERDGVMWFLAKDSSSSARDGNHDGYTFYHEDYIKLKMLTYIVHKPSVKDLLEKMR